MSITEEYLKRAEECERLAGECISESNRAIFMDVAARWRMLAKQAAGKNPQRPKSSELIPRDLSPRSLNLRRLARQAFIRVGPAVAEAHLPMRLLPNASEKACCLAPSPSDAQGRTDDEQHT